MSWRRDFDAARDPYTARNALGITSGGGNVSNSGTPTLGQYAKWVTATTIQGVAPATVLSDIGAQPAGSYQPLDADLTAIAALAGTNTIYYRSAANTWAAVTVGTGLAFSGGNLTATGGGGNVSNVGTPTAGQIAQWTDATHIQGIAAPIGPPQGRLTLQTGVPVMATTTGNTQTIYYTPYIGNSIPLFNGTSFAMTTFAELSAVSTDTTKSPAAIGASKCNDWFVWNDAGTIRLGHGPDWTSDTVRSAGTALVRVNGIWLNNAAITNGAAAQRGTYVGTTRSWTDSSFCWIYGAVAAGGSLALHLVWNAYNRVRVSSLVTDSTDTWSYSVAAWRAVNGSSSNAVLFVSGLAEDVFSAIYTGGAVNNAGFGFGVGLNSSTAFTGTTAVLAPVSNIYTSGIAEAAAQVLGSNYFQAIENAFGAAVTFFGDRGAPTSYSTGLRFYGWM